MVVKKKLEKYEKYLIESHKHKKQLKEKTARRCCRIL